MIPVYKHNDKINYLSDLNKTHYPIYWIVSFILIISAIALPFIKVDISVRVQGIIRPRDEKTELKTSISTIIDSIYFKEGDTVKKGDVIVQLYKENLSIKRFMNDFEINQRNLFINDLIALTRNGDFIRSIIQKLKSPLYKQQASQFIGRISDLTIQLRKLSRELYMDSVLAIDKVIAAKDLFDKEIESERLIVNIQTVKEQQLAVWEEELVRYKMEKEQFENANLQLNVDSSFYLLKAPVSGVIQNLDKYYAGSLVQIGDVLAIISPEAELMADCYINTSNIGFLKKQQQAFFQIDAFDYNYFGVLSGKIESIDNDYTIVDSKPVFKIRCVLNDNQVHLTNGFSTGLKKGMTLQARFLIAKRSLWKLLFDKIDDWINPTAPENK